MLVYRSKQSAVVASAVGCKIDSVEATDPLEYGAVLLRAHRLRSPPVVGRVELAPEVPQNDEARAAQEPAQYGCPHDQWNLRRLVYYHNFGEA